MPRALRYGYDGQVMRSVQIAELKNRLSFYLKQVKSGREVVIRERQNPIARILPIARDVGGDRELLSLAAQGKLCLGEKPLDASFWDLPAPRVSTHALKRALERERDEK